MTTHRRFTSPDPLLSAVNSHRSALRGPECKCERIEGVRYHGLISLEGYRSHHHATCVSCGCAIYEKRGAENLTRDVADAAPIRIRHTDPVTDCEPTPPEAA
jgi:hypothetical protein